MKRTILILVGLAAVVGTALYLSQLTLNRVSRKPGRAEELLQQRADLDKKVWQDEVLAQEYEDVFVKLWDDLRASETKHHVIRDFPFEKIEIGTVSGSASDDLGIKIQNLGAKGKTHSHDQWKTIIREFHEQGYRIIETEWHHSRFLPGPPAHSTISFQLHVTHPKQNAFFVVRGNLEVEWQARKAEDKSPPRPKEIRTQDLRIIERQGAPAFTKVFSTLHKAEDWPVVLAYDLDGDGLSEIVLPRTNQVLRNLGGFKFRDEQLLPKPAGHVSAALLADFNGDGKADLVCAGQETLLLYLANTDGKFAIPGPIENKVQQQLLAPYVLSAGDIDGDGDLDLWIAQYKGPYKEGQMPTPYYDANDGFPSFLLRNDGKGAFTDITETAGLVKKRFRRTYGGSLVDIDNDRDLDLVVASDFAGLDVYLNDGKGQFSDITSRFGDARHSFGMSLSFADYNLDNKLDFFLIGMSSTTARRLERLGLGRDEFPEHQKKRMLMGYGNRMFLADGKGDFQVPKFNDDVARTGWSWGCTSFDFDNDGDSDIYVANGHMSKSTAKDYCTQFWRHDIYTASSEHDPVFSQIFSEVRKNTADYSWNGFEHNVLFMNKAGKEFLNVAFMMGCALEWDSRAVVSDDLDGDGKVDLIVAARSPDTHQVHLLVLRNELQTKNNWVGVRLRDDDPKHSPLGAKVVLVGPDNKKRTTPLVTGDSYMSQHAKTVHFGLGAADDVRGIEIQWPNGDSTIINNPAINRYHDVPRKVD